MISVVDKGGERESVMNDVTEVAVGKDPFAAPGEGERTFSLLLAALDARAIETDAREDAAIEAEAISTQADEALVLG